MRARRLTGCLGALAGALSLSGCFMGDPTGAVLGFRLDHGVVRVAYPICASGEVLGVELHKYTGSGEGGVLWSASGPRSEAVRRGVFTINSPKSFTTTAPAIVLPQGVYVDVTEKGDEGLTGFLDLPKLRAFHPKGPDSYFTADGPMTRAQVNAQMGCNRPHTSTS